MFILVIKSSYFSKTTQQDLFIKEDENDTTGRTLVLFNIPPYISEEILHKLFKNASNVILTKINKNPFNENGFKSATITFQKPTDAYKVLKLKELNHLIKQDILTLGIQKWIKEYNDKIKNQEYLHDRIKKEIEQYDHDEHIKKMKEKSNDADGEGWTLVTKRGRNPGLSRKEAVEVKLKTKIAIKRKRKELQNFYRFQIKESKMQHLINLKKQLEQDKKKISALKQNRRFKPY